MGSRCIRSAHRALFDDIDCVVSSQAAVVNCSKGRSMLSSGAFFGSFYRCFYLCLNCTNCYFDHMTCSSPVFTSCSQSFQCKPSNQLPCLSLQTIDTKAATYKRDHAKRNPDAHPILAVPIAAPSSPLPRAPSTASPAALSAASSLHSGCQGGCSGQGVASSRPGQSSAKAEPAPSPCPAEARSQVGAAATAAARSGQKRRQTQIRHGSLSQNRRRRQI